jgi:hypothetical protein
LQAGDNYPVECVNRSGYKVRDAEGALELVEDLKKIYMRIYVAGKVEGN